MPLFMGDWKLFIDKKQLPLKFSGIDNLGRFLCISEKLPRLETILAGEGFWNEQANKIFFYFYGRLDTSTIEEQQLINFIFNGYLIEGITTGDPGTDKLWTLTGSYQISGVQITLQDAINIVGIEGPSSRRQELGWYAQTTEVV